MPILMSRILKILCLMLFFPQHTFSDIFFTEKQYKNVKLQYGEVAVKRIQKWQNLINSKKHVSEAEKLNEVNSFFNGVNFIDDTRHWGKQDYWATPIEFLGTNGGDCEDFAISKYYTLIALGIPNDKLRLMYVTATRPTRQAHMVLAYYESEVSIPYILDNIVKTIAPASKRRDLIPIYSFNGDGLWLAKAQGTGRKMQNRNNSSLWDDLKTRMEKEYR